MLRSRHVEKLQKEFQILEVRSSKAWKDSWIFKLGLVWAKKEIKFPSWTQLVPINPNLTDFVAY